MANAAKEFTWGVEQDDVTMHFQFTAGAAGAVGTTYGSTLFYPGGPVLSVTKPNATTGIYRVTMRETWYRLVNVWGTILQASFTNTHAGDVFLSADNVNDATKQYFEIVTRSLDTTAAATDVTSTDIVKFTAVLRMTSPRVLGF